MNQQSSYQKLNDMLILISIATLFTWIGIIITIVSYASNVINSESILVAIGPILFIMSLITIISLIIFLLAKKYLPKTKIKWLIISLWPFGFIALIILIKKEKQMTNN